MASEETEAEDICQEAFLKIVKNRKRYNPQKAKFITWLFTIAHNLCHDRYRKRKKYCHVQLDSSIEYQLNKTAFDIPMNPADEVESAELSEQIEIALVALPPEQREVILLHHYNGFKFKEIAEIMDCPINTVKSHDYRARQTLKKMLMKYIY
jgi:RNA polymerase sigma-70 factor (ECF subfamily)